MFHRCRVFQTSSMIISTRPFRRDSLLLLQAEALRKCQGQLDLLLHLGLGLVLGQEESVEASRSRGKILRIWTHALNRYGQLAQASHGRAMRAGRKRKKVLLHLGREFLFEK